MGLFSRKKKDKYPERPFSSKDIHDSFAVFVDEAKFVGTVYGLNFMDLGPYQKVFSFIHENPSCMAFIVTAVDGIHLIQCAEGDPKIIEISYEEILEAEILDDYVSDSLYSDQEDSDNSVVHHLRTPRAAMSLVTKDLNSVLIANSAQMQFVAGYLAARRMSFGSDFS